MFKNVYNEGKELQEVDDADDYQYGAVSDLYDAAEPAAPMTKEKLIETGKDVADFATDFIPGVSEAKDIYSLSENVSKGDYVGAGIDATSLALGIVPGVGDLARKGFRSSVAPLRKLFDKLPEQERMLLPKQPDDKSLIGYHGTARERKPDEPFFDINFARKNDQFLGEGFYFTLDPKIAEEYSNLRAFRDFDVAPIKKGQDPVLTHRETGQKTTPGNLQKGLDVEGNPLAMGQSVSRFDLSNIEKPYVVRTEKQRKELKAKIPQLKEEGYDAVLFADFKDRSKQIMVFPEHMDKIDTSSIAGSARNKVGSLRKQDMNEAEKFLDDPDSLQKWRDDPVNTVDKTEKKRRETRKYPEQAQALESGLMSGPEYRRYIRENQPATKFTLDDLQTMVPTFKATVGALGKSKASKGIVGLNKNIEKGTIVDSRLDIPAYNYYNTWVASMTLPNKGGNVYGRTAVLKNVDFSTSMSGEKILKIAKDEKTKTPMATMKGEWQDLSDEDAFELAQKYLANPKSGYVQVGFNPERHSFFYDKDTMMPIFEAEEVVQIGALVLAKPKLPKTAAERANRIRRLRELKIENPDRIGRPAVFNSGGLMARR